ncbi:MAG: PhnD/SsuA/transferrin family substrate-binding protein [Hydrogenophilaceae bacterium]|nr:PhnD/SsuA/transferrin family substrate-binding protein [Hydrogenophilaceae bacterium]
MSTKTLLKAAFLFLIFSLAGPLRAAADQPLLFGSVAMDTPAVMQKRLLPLTSYLSKALGRPVVLKLSTNMPEAINALVANEVDIAYLTPVAYVDARARSDVQLIVKTVTDKQPFFKLMIVVLENSPIRKVEDLAGKSFAFGDRAALLQRAVVVGAGMPLERLGKYDFLDHYDNVVRSVLVGDFDAGIVIDSTAYRWRGKGVRILYSSKNLPPYNIAGSSKLDRATQTKLRDALLRLDPAKPEHKQIITALSEAYSGFAATKDAEYEIVRKLIKPFKK